MSEKLQNLMQMLAGLSPSELLSFTQAAHERSKEVSEELSSAKKEFLDEICSTVEGSMPPEVCTIGIVFDETGHIVERTYKSGQKVKASGVVGSKGATAMPPLGSLAMRTYKGEQHTLLYRGDGDYLLDNKVEVKSPTDAAKRVRRNTVAVNGRAWWFEQGTIKLPV
jgi:hypothetical protein